MIRLDADSVRPFLDDGTLEALRPRVVEAHRDLIEKRGTGNEMLGWRDLLLDPDETLLDDVEATAARIRRDADVLLCIGIGGSYLGARAVIQALSPYFSRAQTTASGNDGADGHSRNPDRPPEVLFAGHHLSGAYLRELMDALEGQSVFVNVISKSGTTLEAALAFRFIRRWMEMHFDDADARIIVTTSPTGGALNKLREQHAYKKYAIPEDVGGRFSVLTPVGLLPIAAAGLDVRALLDGAAAACRTLTDADDNAALEYAALRYLLLGAGYDVEVLAVFEPRLSGIGAWWQQLFGESEGKQGTGLYPATVQYSTDLHSLGQYMQEGQRIVVETFLMPEDDGGSLVIPSMEANLDGLDDIAGQTLTDVTRSAHEGTAKAHTDGGVPNLTVWFDAIKADALGEVLYFFEHAVAVSGYLLGVNPFNQPGVEAYKREMYQRLGL